MRIIHEMPLDRITGRAGRWNLRHAALDDEADTHIWLISATSREGTLAVDLYPETIEISVGDMQDDLITLSVDDILAIATWPPKTND